MPPTRVPIVEDDTLLAMAMEDAVRALGFEVLGPSGSLRDGLERAQTGDMNFALLDYDLGHGTDALPIAEELSRQGIPFVSTTATDPKVIRTQVPLAKVLTKPVSALDLARALR